MSDFQSRSTKAILEVTRTGFSNIAPSRFKIDKDKSSNFNLVKFALALNGDNSVILDTGVEVTSILQENAIPFREIQTPYDIYSTSRQTMISFLDDTNTPVVVYRKFNSTYIFNPEVFPVPQRLASGLKLKPFSYEIYSRWPEKVSSPLDILKFGFRSNWFPLYLVLFSALLIGALNLFVPVLTSYLVNTIIPFSDYKLIAETSLLVVLVAFITIITRFFNNLSIVRMETILNLKVETALWTHLLNQPLEFFSRFGAADLVERIGGISRMRIALSKGLLTAFLSLIFACSNVFLMVYHMWTLTLVALVLSLLNLVVVCLIVYRKSFLVVPLQTTQAEVSDLGLRAVNGMPQIRVSGSEPIIFARWYEYITKLININQANDFYGDVLEIVAATIKPFSQVMMFALFILFTKYGIISDDLGPDVAVASFIGFQAAYQAFNLQFSLAIKSLSSAIADILGYWKRLVPVMYSLPEELPKVNSLTKSLRGDFEFRDVSLRFADSDNSIFENISFSIPAGSYTAITGPSGSGKSCLTKCLLRLLDYENGDIFADGINISRLALRPYRQQFGVVMQNTVLPSGSIYEIVKAGRVFSRDDVWDALEKAQIIDEVKAMPMELETVINDSAGSISGGQRQRIALARALISNPKVLILDEATSALDSATQSAVMHILNDLPVTRIAVAHRLSTIESADQVIVLSNKKIQEIGTFRELKKKSNSYFS